MSPSKFFSKALKKISQISHLLECLRTQKVKGNAKLGPFPKSAGVLAVTSGELWEDESGIEEEFAPVGGTRAGW